MRQMRQRMSGAIWYFRGLRFGERVPAQVMEALRKSGRIERWGHNADITHEGDDGRVYVVLQGGVYVQDRARERAPLRRGDAFGALHEDARAESALRAFDDTLLVSATREDFDALAGPHLGESIAALGAPLRRKRYTVPLSSLLYAEPEHRFARAVLHLIETRGQLSGDHGELRFPHAAHRLAPLIGVSPQRAREIVRALSARDIVRDAPTSLIVPSLEQLREVAVGASGPRSSSF